MSEKVKVSRATADLIEILTEDYNNEEIVSLFTAKKLVKQAYELSLDALIRALYIGYEVEETPEEQLQSAYLHHIAQSNSKDPNMPDGERVMYANYAHGIKFALNTLNIKIEGVNA
jgi:hypothetical protein